jgi:DNA-binding NarL/FixJ family response regulator
VPRNGFPAEVQQKYIGLGVNKLNMNRGTYELNPAIELPATKPGSAAMSTGSHEMRSATDERRSALAYEAPSVDASTSTIELVLVGGGRLMRGAIASLLAAQEGFAVQGTFESAAHFLARDFERPPNVVLLDCDGDPDGWRSAVSVLGHTHPGTKLVMLCQEMCPETIRYAMEHRVGGVILKSYSTEDIRQALMYMASGRTIMPAGWQRAAASVRRDPLALSPRLRQILTLIAQGQSNEQIAAVLELSPNTVKFHVRAIYARLGVRNRVEAALLYAQMTRGAG